MSADAEQALPPAGGIVAGPAVERVLALAHDMWHRRWLGLAVAWLVGAGAAGAVALVPDRWEANARVYVDTQSILKPLLQGLTVQPDVDQMVAMLARTLVSRPNVEKLISNGGLDTGLPALEREKLIQTLIQQIKVTNTVGGRGNNLYDIAYRDPDAARAGRVVTGLVALFVSSGQGEKAHDTEEARRFIDEQIAVYEGKLAEAENRLKNFRLRNLDVTGGTPGQDYFTRISQLQQDLASVEVDLRAAEQSRDALQRQAAQARQDLPTVTTARLGEIDGRIEAQRRLLDDLLRQYTDQHPDVISARRLMVQLESERAQIAQQPSGPTLPRGQHDNNLAYDQIKVKLAEAEASLAALRGRAAQMQARLAQLHESAAQVPKVEAELAQLNRDYDVIKHNYEQLVQRRESASISGNQDVSTGFADFRVVDPPRVDPRPVFPSRVVLIPFALFAALLAGVGACFAYVEAFPTVGSLRQLRLLSGRAVAGAIALHTEIIDSRLRRMDRFVFYPALVLLALAFLGWEGMALAAAR